MISIVWCILILDNTEKNWRSIGFANVTLAEASVGMNFDHVSSTVIEIKDTLFTGSTTAVNIHYGDPEITLAGVLFEENNAAISYYGSGASLSVFSSDFVHNEMGFNIKYPHHANFVINSSYFKQNIDVMEITNPQDKFSLIIGMNIFQKNTKGITLTGSPGYISWTLYNNTFIGFTESAIHLVGKGKIISNVFQNNTFLTSPIAKIVSTGEEFMFEKNVFENNFGYFEMLDMDITCPVVTIIENIITDNHVAKPLIVINSQFSNKLQGNAKFISNKLQHNIPLDKCFPLSAIVLKGQKGFNISANIFTNPLFKQELHCMIPSFNKSSQIDLSYNFWGTNDTNIIGRRSYHGTKSVVPVKYVPFYVDETLETLERHPVHHTIHHYVLPSTLQHTLHIRTGETYKVKENLLIPPGIILSMSPGSRLEIQQNKTIHIYGTFIVNGSADEQAEIVTKPYGTSDECGVLLDNAGHHSGVVHVVENETYSVICSSYWSTENSKVICRSLGLGTRMYKTVQPSENYKTKFKKLIYTLN